eukprot:10711445-Alexandrium_andersonii.AAC.1
MRWIARSAVSWAGAGAAIWAGQGTHDATKTFHCSARKPADPRDATMDTTLACILVQTGSQVAARKCSTDRPLHRPTGSSGPSPAGDVEEQPRCGADRATASGPKMPPPWA